MQRNMTRWAQWTQLAIGMALALLATMPAAFGADVTNGAPNTEVPLVVGGRTVHVFRGMLGDISAAERAQAARDHIEAALDIPGEGWTSVVPSAEGVIVSLDGKPMFTVTPGDARNPADQTPDSLANQASRNLQKVWTESQERRDPRVNVVAIAKVAAASIALLAILALCAKISQWLHRLISRRLADHIDAISTAGFGSQFSGIFARLAARLSVLLLWLFGLLAVFLFLTYALGQFALTRPISENLSGSLTSALYDGLRSGAAALPGLFVAVIIFMIARIATQISRAMFSRISAGHLKLGALDAHTAPATRHLVNAAIWLFALAMAYPYLPGSHTEAFKGLSVLLGIMVSIGASGLVGQIASGLILAFTRALMVGEYVRILDCEGTVTHLGLCVTRLRTGTGEEVALPNSLVINNITRNLSRNVERGGFVLDTTVTIGYDTPWRQVHAMLLEATKRVPSVRPDPAPFVLQTALSDFYVEYRLVTQVGAESRPIRPHVLGELNAAILDVFNTYGVQIMSPNYRGDPETVKMVPPSDWYKAPAKRDS